MGLGRAEGVGAPAALLLSVGAQRAVGVPEGCHGRPYAHPCGAGIPPMQEWYTLMATFAQGIKSTGGKSTSGGACKL